jgi:hypothetical protein
VIEISTSRGSAMTGWLRTLDKERLSRLIAARQDAVADPEPCDLGELAGRLQRPGSVALILPRLPLPALQASEALASLGVPVGRGRLAALLGATEGPGALGLDRALAVLADHALVWPAVGTDVLHMAAPLRQAWSAPLGLDGPLAQQLSSATSAELRAMLTALGLQPPGSKQQRLQALLDHHRDPDRVRAVVATAPAGTRKVLERHARSGSRRSIVLSAAPAALSSPERWALERGLLVRDRYGVGPARMPSEVALALRGPGWRAPFDPHAPEPAITPVADTDVAREAAAMAGAFAGQAASVLAECAARPPARLKSGGVGARELARLSKAVQCDEPVVRLVLECGYAAGLLARDGDRVPVTEAYDAWSEHEPAGQLAELLRVWWTLGLTPSAARDEDGKALPALMSRPLCQGCVGARHGLLTAAADLPESHGVRDTEDLGAVLVWHRPLAEQQPHEAAPFATVVREAELLGVLARGALSPLGAALLRGSPLEEPAVALLPAASDTAHIGADLTAVVTGTPSARLARLLDAVANREARGTASVWRFSAAGIRRALDAGRTADEISTDLSACAEGPLPQPLSYLISDTARRHGHLRIASATCVVHGTDPALLAEIAAHRKLGTLGLRLLAPTVLISRASVTKTLDALRAEGYAPVAEGADGAVRVEKPQQPRAATSPALRTARIPGPRRRTPPTTPDLAGLAARLLAAPDRAPDPDPLGGVPFATDTEEILTEYAKQLPATDIRQLAHAIHENEPITIEYVATSGNHTVRTVSDIDFDPPYLHAWCHLRDDERVFSLSRIQGVMPAGV